MENLFRNAVEATSLNSKDKEHHARANMHHAYINRLFQELTDLIVKQSIVEENVMDAANRGNNRVTIWSYRGYEYGHDEIMTSPDAPDITYQCKPMPIAFLVNGPKQDRKKRVYGLKWFTLRDIEPLQQRLALKFMPFRVYVNMVSSSEFEVVLNWADKKELTTYEHEEEGDEVGVEL